MLRQIVTEAEPRRTPLYETQRTLGARFVPFAGWDMPVQFAGITIEHHAVREQAGLFDVSHMGRLRVTGPAAARAVDRLVTNALDRIADGRAVYGCCCNASGNILDDLICYRESSESVFVICNASNRDKIKKHFLSELAPEMKLSDLTDETSLLALQGPESHRILEALDGHWATVLPRMGFARSTLAGHDVTIAVTGYTGELGVEIVCARESLVAIYQTLLDEGRAFGLVPAGLGCRDTLRLEARLSLYGNEIDETTNPIEAGLGWTVKLDKPDFIGKAALAEFRARGLARIVAGLEMLGRGIARHGYTILDTASHAVGHITSGSPSPTLNKNIALGYVPVQRATVGTRLLVDCRGKLVEAQIVPTPFYKRQSA